MVFYRGGVLGDGAGRKKKGKKDTRQKRGPVTWVNKRKGSGGATGSTGNDSVVRHRPGYGVEPGETAAVKRLNHWTGGLKNKPGGKHNERRFKIDF